MKQLKNSWINVKRSELLQLLVSFFSDGLGIIPFQGLPKAKGHSKAFIRMDYFHIFIMYLVQPVSAPPVS